MMNSADCRSKTARAPAGSPSGENSSRGKGLIQGRGARYRRTHKTSRNAFHGRTAALSCTGGVKERGTATNLETPSIARNLAAR